MVKAQYLYGLNNAPISMTRDGQTYYYIYNAHGDTIALADATGKIAATYTYTPWGVVTTTSTINNPFLYAGHFGIYHDNVTGLDLMQTRYYNGNIFRFISPDEFAGIVAKPISHNSYIYVQDDPVNNVNPDGHWPQWLNKDASWVRKKVSSAFHWVAQKVSSAVHWVRQKFSQVKHAVIKTATAAAYYISHPDQAYDLAKEKVAEAEAAAEAAAAKAEEEARQAKERFDNAVASAKESVQKELAEAKKKALEVGKQIVKGAKAVGNEMVKDAKAVGNFVKEHKEQILAGVKIVGSVVETAVGAVMIASGVGAGLGAALVAYGVNGIISGGADMYYASTGQKDKIGTVNPLKGIFQGVLGKQVGGAAFETSDFVLGMVGGGGELKTAAKATEYAADADKAIEAVNSAGKLDKIIDIGQSIGDKFSDGIGYLKDIGSGAKDKLLGVFDSIKDSKLGRVLADERGSWGKVDEGAGKARPDFYVAPSGEAIPSTGYRYMSKNSSFLKDLENTMEIPENAYGTYFSFNKYNVANPGAIQVPHDAAIRGSFDTLQIIDDIRIPNGRWGEASHLEPLAKDFPQFGPGNATQAVTNKAIKLDELTKLPEWLPMVNR